MRTEKRPVRVGLGELSKPMTRQQAWRYGERNMPRSLRQAGFETIVFASDPVINGGLFFRVNYGKKC